MSNTALIKKLKGDLLRSESKLCETIDSLNVDWKQISDSKDPLAFVLDSYKEYIPGPITSGVILKNKDKALEHKQQGNQLYKEGKLLEARDAYTQALRFCPINEKNPSDNKDYAIILANRSATSEGLSIHEGVIQDVDLALKYGYPKEMNYKVLNRKAQAYKKLRQFFSSKETYKKVLDMIGKSDMPTKMRDQWRTRIKKQINLFGIKKDAQPAKDMDHPFNNLSEGPSSQIQEMSSKLSINEDKVVCQEEVMTEDRLFLESPLVTILSDPRSFGKLCPLTLKKMPAPIPCIFGSSEYFYDEETRAKANGSFHKYEWPIVKELKENLSSVSHLSLRLIFTNPQDILQEIMHESMSTEEAFYGGLLGTYIHKALVKVKYPLLLSEVECAKLVIYTYKNRIHISKFLTEEDRSKLLESGFYPRHNYGIGIYPQYSFIMSKSKASHSNDVFTHFIGSKLLVVANRRISQGDPITFKSMANLGSAMNEVVLFKCEGSPKCQLSFPLKENTTEQVVICPLPECSVDTNIWRLLKRLHELKREVKIGKEIFLGSNRPESLREALLKYQGTVDEFTTFIERPYAFITQLEKEMRLFIELDIQGKEDNWVNRSDTEFKNDLFA